MNNSTNDPITDQFIGNIIFCVYINNTFIEYKWFLNSDVKNSKNIKFWEIYWNIIFIRRHINHFVEEYQTTRTFILKIITYEKIQRALNFNRDISKNCFTT